MIDISNIVNDNVKKAFLISIDHTSLVPQDNLLYEPHVFAVVAANSIVVIWNNKTALD
jgi:hypothetical protein